VEQDYLDNGLEGCSHLQIGFPLNWFTLGIEYHHVHHLNARIPGYRLKAAHLYIQQHHPHFWQAVPTLTLSSLFTQGGGLIIYDQDNHQYLSLE